MISKWTAPFGRIFRAIALSLMAVSGAASVMQAAPYAFYVMDARTGETLIADNADTRLHPASLTKMMTLYIAFQEVERGNLSLDSMITVSKNAAAQPPSRLGLKAGQKIQLRYLIRAAAVKSANDAAAAIGDAIGGNQAQFADMMTRTAKSLGMKHTTFKNANGLTAKGHLSTAKDMSILGRHLFYDFPQYYNIFSRRTTDAGVATVTSTNRKFLDAYRGADGIKTGYTQPAGFNLTASAERNGVRLIATVFGGKSTADRNARATKLLDKGFAMVKQGGPAPVLTKPDDDLVAGLQAEGAEDGAPSSGKTVRVNLAVKTSIRPQVRPDKVALVDGAETAVEAMADDIAGALAEASDQDEMDSTESIGSNEDTTTAKPVAEKTAEELVQDSPVIAPQTDIAALDPAIEPSGTTKKNPPIYDNALVATVAADVPGQVVTRVSTLGESHFGINVGRFETQDSAERILLKMQLVESATLAGSQRSVTQKGGGFDANFLGLTQEAAELACRRLTARSIQCLTLGP